MRTFFEKVRPKRRNRELLGLFWCRIMIFGEGLVRPNGNLKSCDAAITGLAGLVEI